MAKKTSYIAVLALGLLAVFGCGKNPVLSYPPEGASSGGGGGGGTGSTVVTYFSEKFDTYTTGPFADGTGGWLASTSGTSGLTIHSETTGGKSLQFFASGSSYSIDISHSITPVSKATLQYDFKNGVGFTFTLATDSSSGPVVLTTSNGVLGVHVNLTDTNTLHYNPAAWNTLSVSLDLDNKTYAVKLNGKTAQIGSLGSSAGTTVTGVAFSESGNTLNPYNTYFDNFVITDK